MTLSQRLNIFKISLMTLIETPRGDESCFIFTPGWRQSKTSILSTNVDQKSLETEFSIVICRQSGDK